MPKTRNLGLVMKMPIIQQGSAGPTTRHNAPSRAQQPPEIYLDPMKVTSLLILLKIISDEVFMEKNIRRVMR
jgi:hypothetical protein